MRCPADKRRRSGGAPTPGVVALALAIVLAAMAPLALGATAPAHGTTHASGPSRHGKCARHARRHRRRHRRCSAAHHAAPKAPVLPAPALVAPYGPVAQPGVLVAALPAPAAPATSGPASEGAAPAPGGGGETGETGEGGEPPSVPHVQVSAVEYAFTLSRTTVPAGKVVFQFVNNGQDEHNLQIASFEGPLVGAFADTPAKGIGDLTLEVQPGQYKLFCSLPTHEQEGMKATLTVE
jgi:plastocyanin